MGKRARVGIGIACVAAAIVASRFTGGAGEAAASTPRARRHAVRHAPALAIEPTTNGLAVVLPGDDGGTPTGSFCVPIRTVTDAGADPDVALVLTDVDTGDVLLEARTDAEGALEACLGAREAYVDAWDDESRWARAYADLGDPAIDGPIAPSILRLIETPTLTGTVVDESGAPIAGAEIELVEFRPDYRGRPMRGYLLTFELTGEVELRADAHGRFDVRLGQAGLFAVIANADGFREGIEGPVVARPGAHEDVRLVLPRGAAITGRALLNGEPLPGASIMVFDGFARIGTDSDAQGRFSVDGLVPGATYDVAITGSGAVPTTFPVQAPIDRDFELELATRVRVEISMDPRLARCVRPPVAIDILTRAAGDAHCCRGTQTVVADPLAHAVFDDLPAGSQTVIARVQWAFATTEVETVPGHDAEVSLVLHADPQRSLLGVTLIEPDGALAEGLVSVSGPIYDDVAIDDAGHACLMLEAGTYSLATAHGRAELTIGPAEQGTRRIRLDPLPVQPDVVGGGEADEDVEIVCSVPFSTEYVGEELWVSSILPGSPLEVGDRIVRVDEQTELDAMAYALEGPRGTRARVDAIRPDGARFFARIERSNCD